MYVDIAIQLHSCMLLLNSHIMHTWYIYVYCWYTEIPWGIAKLQSMHIMLCSKPCTNLQYPSFIIATDKIESAFQAENKAYYDGDDEDQKFTSTTPSIIHQTRGM